MNHTIGDGMVVLALAGGIVAYLHLRNKSRQHRMEIIHRERMAAMEKGIPLPELPFDPEQRQDPSGELVVPILGIVLFCLSAGAMIALRSILPAAEASMWIAPLPFAFLGVGLMAFHFLKGETRR